MKKIAKLFSVVAVAAAACTFFSLNSSNEIICGNIEALTGGDNGGGPEMPLIYEVLLYGGDQTPTGGYYEVAGTNGDCAYTPCIQNNTQRRCVRIVYSYQDYLNWLGSND